MCKRLCVRTVLVAGLLALFSTATFSQSANPQQQTVQDFSFALFGDLGYRPEQEPLVDNVLADINRTPLAFVVHVGDLGSPRAGSCTDAFWAHRLEQFRASSNPLIYTPGDNEWTDCHEQQGAPGADPLERLGKLRNVFFESERSFGQRSIALTRQSQGADPKFANYRENAR
jgi:hypothetical protein